MWYPMRAPASEAGSVRSVRHIALSSGDGYTVSCDDEPDHLRQDARRVIGLHWNQWETEADTGSKALNDAEANYKNLFWGFFTALGSDESGAGIPLYLYRPLCETLPPERTKKLSELFDTFTGRYADCRIMDARESGFYDDTPKTHGIFQPDGGHYLPEVHRYFAERQWKDISWKRMKKTGITPGSFFRSIFHAVAKRRHIE